MDPQRLRALLEAAIAGRATVDDTLRALSELPFRDLGFAHADTHRHLRTGFPEVVLGEGKTPEQIAAILISSRSRGAGEAVWISAQGGAGCLRASWPPASPRRWRRQCPGRPGYLAGPPRGRGGRDRRRPIAAAASSPW